LSIHPADPGGAGKVAEYINTLRETDDNVIALDLGNFFWGMVTPRIARRVADHRLSPLLTLMHVTMHSRVPSNAPGNLFYQAQGIAPAVAAHNGIGYDFVGLGEVDFYSCNDDSPEADVCPTLASFIKQVNGTMLAANIDWSTAKYLNETEMKSWDVKVTSGVKVGFVGFTGI
jgi:2',3'-cyclic-nucleotide 2'-phosphodiesterase (5'-nucleotidase family)